MNAKGPVFKYGDNIDTDVIIPARDLNTQSAAELASESNPIHYNNKRKNQARPSASSHEEA